MLIDSVIFVLDNVVAFFVILLLARFHFQWLRVGFRNQVGEFILATTNWIVMPARRVIPGLAGLDLASFLAALLLESLGIWLHYVLIAASPGPIALVAVSFVFLVRYSLYILIFALFVMALLSWVNPYAPVLPVFDALTRPFLRPLRRFIPPVARVDLTPMVLLLILFWIVLYPVVGLEHLAAGL
jgi:YggT family protein